MSIIKEIFQDDKYTHYENVVPSIILGDPTAILIKKDSEAANRFHCPDGQKNVLIFKFGFHNKGGEYVEYPLPSKVASRPIRNLIFVGIDEDVPSPEGSIIKLMKRRTINYKDVNIFNFTNLEIPRLKIEVLNHKGEPFAPNGIDK